MRLLLNLLLLFLFTTTGIAQEGVNTVAEEEAYTNTINQRAAKIVSSLRLKDSSRAAKVQSIISGQYRNLNEIHSNRDARIKAIKVKGDSKEVTAAAIKKIEIDATAELQQLHTTYIRCLSSYLTPDQINGVKDGMTYNVVPITYNGYLDMLPNLTTEQKAQIMAWLVEAREYAMDAETSEKKHWWFGKYKGRINNYLSAADYDLKKESEAWQKRLKEREEKKKAAGH